MDKIVPAAYRSVTSHAKKMPDFLLPLLREQLVVMRDCLSKTFPFIGPESSAKISGLPKLVFKPRFIIYGRSGMGQNYFGGEMLHLLEEIPTFCFDMVGLLGGSSKVT
jgi:hypothetical protein